MKTLFIYPASFLSPKKRDESFEQESPFLFPEDVVVYPFLRQDLFKIKGNTCLYRGWMLREQEYDALETEVQKAGGTLLVSKDDYLHAHHLPNWIEEFEKFTPQTRVIAKKDLFDLERVVEELFETKHWTRIFVKDYVKSLTTSKGSMCGNLKEVLEVVQALDEYRGIEGGVCLRQGMDFFPDTERRYFVVNGQVFSPPSQIIPDLAFEVGQTFKHPFFSLDLVQDVDGREWLVEVGDGQVSEFKHPWANEDIELVFHALQNLNSLQLKPFSLK